MSNFETVMSQAQVAMQQASAPFESPSYRIESDSNLTLASAVGALSCSIHQVAEALRMNALAAMATSSTWTDSASTSVSGDFPR